VKLTQVLVISVGVLCSAVALAETAAPKAPDNTAVNSRDANGNTLTAGDQSKGTQWDVELTRKIRQMVTADKSLSTDAHNVKIVTLHGVATLRGPVRSLEERKKVASLAAKVNGVASVRDELEITPRN
jgi:hyperosmotically inducible protein